MMQPGRKFQATPAAKYRYSINGQERESELNENITTALYWEYDSRIMRRWNIDPKPNVAISQYNCFNGNPIVLADLLGDTTGLMTKQGKFIDRIDDDKSNEVHYLSRLQALQYRIAKFFSRNSNELAVTTRANSTAFIGKNTIADMKKIEKEGGTIHEVGFVGTITTTREIRLISLGIKYSQRTAAGWVYQMEQAVNDYSIANPNSKPFLTGHLHPWSTHEESGVNADGQRRSGPTYKFYDREPTWRDRADYQPLLKNPENIFIYKNNDGSTAMDLLKGPHPALIVTRFGYITYGTGSNSANSHAEGVNGGTFEIKSAQRVKFNVNYFHIF